jgi:hypothetical protein
MAFSPAAAEPALPLLNRHSLFASSCANLLTSAYVSLCQHTSAYVSIRQPTSAYVSLRQPTSAYISLRQYA